MSFAVEIDADDHAAAMQVLSQVSEWNRPPGRSYETAEATHIEHPLIACCARAFFIRIPPKGFVHRHRDPPQIADDCDTDHIVCVTNSRCLNYWESDGQQRSVHLELGKRYRVIDRGATHWAVNDGDTDRIHLLIEYPKESTSRRG